MNADTFPPYAIVTGNHYGFTLAVVQIDVMFFVYLIFIKGNYTSSNNLKNINHRLTKLHFYTALGRNETM